MASIVIRVRGVVCVVSSTASFSNHRPCLESYWVSLRSFLKLMLEIEGHFLTSLSSYGFCKRFFCFLKASIIGRKKEAVAEKLQEAMDEVRLVHANSNWSRVGYL